MLRVCVCLCVGVGWSVMPTLVVTTEIMGDKLQTQSNGATLKFMSHQCGGLPSVTVRSSVSETLCAQHQEK